MKILNIDIGTYLRCVIVALSLVWVSCEVDNEITYNEDKAQFQEVTDPYLQVQTSVIGYQAGAESYDFKIYVINGTKSINKLNIYNVFTSAETGNSSNEVLIKSFNVEGALRNVITGTINYEDLKAGLVVDGNPLPESDGTLKVGSAWKFRFEGVRPDGTIIPLAGSINVAVLSPYAGVYKVIDSEYYRIGVFTGEWTGETRFIGSVNETTFSYNDYWGYFPWTGSQFNFSVNFDDNKITVPIIVKGIFSGNRAINCTNDAGLFGFVPCEGSNVLIKDPENPNSSNAPHRIRLTYGYFTDGSGSREFYEELEKVVVTE